MQDQKTANECNAQHSCAGRNGQYMVIDGTKRSHDPYIRVQSSSKKSEQESHDRRIRNQYCGRRIGSLSNKNPVLRVIIDTVRIGGFTPPSNLFNGIARSQFCMIVAKPNYINNYVNACTMTMVIFIDQSARAPAVGNSNCPIVLILSRYDCRHVHN